MQLKHWQSQKQEQKKESRGSQKSAATKSPPASPTKKAPFFLGWKPAIIIRSPELAIFHGEADKHE